MSVGDRGLVQMRDRKGLKLNKGKDGEREREVEMGG